MAEKRVGGRGAKLFEHLRSKAGVQEPESKPQEQVGECLLFKYLQIFKILLILFLNL